MSPWFRLLLLLEGGFLINFDPYQAVSAFSLLLVNTAPTRYVVILHTQCPRSM
jgi:hypothetical protein